MLTNNLEERFHQVIERTVDDKALLQMELRDRMAVMAKLAQELIRSHIEQFFVAAVVTESGVVFPANVVTDDYHKEAIQNSVIELAHRANALCVIIVMMAWAVKKTPENVQPHLRHSEHPERQEVLVLDGKDYFEHLMGMQSIRRTEGRVDFGQLEIGSSPRSLLDQWQVKAPTTTDC